MLYSVNDINNHSVEDFLSYHKQRCEEWDEQREVDALLQLEEFKEKHYYLYKPVSELTMEEKTLICEESIKRAIAHETAYIDLLTRAEVRDMSRYYNPRTMSNEKMALQQRILISYAPTGKKKEYFTNKFEDERECIIFKISKNDVKNRNLIEKMGKIALFLKKSELSVNIAINDEMEKQSNDEKANYLYSKEEMNNLLAIDNYFKSNNVTIPIVFDEHETIKTSMDCYNAWGLSEVVKANNEIDNLVDSIKQMKLSPFESVVYIHSYLTKNYRYREGLDKEASRVIPGAVNKGTIVCSGYASFVKAAIDKLNIPELKCDILSSALYEKSFRAKLVGGHCNNLITIVDSKYGINGHYIEDACWDAKTTKFEHGRGFAHCLYPVGDLEHLSTMHYVQKDATSRFAALMYEPSEREYLEKDREAYLRGRKRDSMIAKYLHRKSLIKQGSKVVKIYSNTSKKIPVEAYRGALTLLHTKTMGGLSDKSVERIEKDMENSMLHASKSFDSRCQSDFALQAREKEKAHKTTFAELDGRTL